MRAPQAVLFLAYLACEVASDLDIRVAKGVKERGYDAVRVSMIDLGQGSKEAFFDYHGKFYGAWEKFHLHSAVKQVKGNATFSVAGQEVRIRIPAEGARVRGLIFSDPCISSAGGMFCQWQEMFKTEERLAKVVSQFVGSDDIDFWGILGDNFYESNQAGGDITKGFFEALSAEAKAKPLLSVPGNHDFWIAGGPPGLDKVDQFAYGFMQMYGQDTLAGFHGRFPYDFRIPAQKGNLPVQENFVFSHQIGDVAFFGYSGAHTQDQLHPHLLNFCAWLAETPSAKSAVILGHWNVDNLGCEQGMATPEVYEAARTLPGCQDKDLIFIDGHDHCNRMHSRYPDHGYLIGGNGMGGDCPRQQFGFLVLDSDPRSGLRVDYFELSSLGAQDFVVRDTGQLDALKAALEGESNFLPQGVHLGEVFVPSGVVDSISVGTKPTVPMVRKSDLPTKIAKGDQLVIKVEEVSSAWDALQNCVKANPARPYTACRAQFSQHWRMGRPPTQPPPPPTTPLPPTTPRPPLSSLPPPPNTSKHHSLPKRTSREPSEQQHHRGRKDEPRSPHTVSRATTTTSSTRGRQPFHIPDHSVDVVVPDLGGGIGHPHHGGEVEVVTDEDHRKGHGHGSWAHGHDILRDPGPEVFHEHGPVSLADHDSFRDAGSSPTPPVQPDYRISHRVGDEFPLITLMVTSFGMVLMVVGGCLAAWTAGGSRPLPDTDPLLKERETTSCW